ncbi:MAG: tetratricopeptide repeat protein, partial [Prolixibacteraceae bacterium]|nr:tetratricopeptide repeat protein [Prolixibacteraceae bacterium]
FQWEDSLSQFSKWCVCISDSTGSEIYTGITDQAKWRPDAGLWNELKQQQGKNYRFYAIGIKKGLFKKEISYNDIEFSISPDSVNAPVFFRAVPLPFSYAVANVNEIEWHMGNVGEKPKKMLDNIPICANCHSFPANGKSLAMDVDYANDKGSYTISPIEDSCLIKPDDIISWSEYRREDGEKTFGLLSQISPDGRYAVSTVKDRSVFVAIDANFKYSQLFFPVKGILAYYDTKTKKFDELQGACDKKYVQSNPTWSPDGKEIMFARNTRYSSDKIDNKEDVLLTISDADEFISGEKEFKFNLHRLPFNEGKGGKPVPVNGASFNGKSNFFARYSPDGKWVVFCQADNFMLLQPDSKLYILPAEGGTPRLMNCNTGNMNSWHSWSPNSKWIVFASKEYGPYTQLFLTHIDEEGNDSPPVLLESFLFEKKAANIPEFYYGKSDDFVKIIDGFSESPLYCVRNASEDISHNEYLNAYKNLERAIELDSQYFDAYITRIKLNKILSQGSNNKYINDYNTALQIINKKIAEKPNDEQLLINRANLYLFGQEYNKVINDAKKALKINPKNTQACEVLCAGYNSLSNWDKAIEGYIELLKLHPDNDKEIKMYLSTAYLKKGQKHKASEIIEDLIAQYPCDGVLYINRAIYHASEGNMEAFSADIDKAVELTEDNYMVFLKRADIFESLNDPVNTEKEHLKALDVFNRLLEKNPANLELLFERASLYQNMKKYDEAVSDYNKVLEYIPDNYRALKSIIQIKFQLQDWEPVLRNYAILRENYSFEPEFYINPAIVKIRMNDKNSALSLFNDGLKVSPQNTDLLFNRAMLLFDLNEKNKGLNDINLLVKILDEKRSKGIISDKEKNILTKAEQVLKKNS